MWWKVKDLVVMGFVCEYFVGMVILDEVFYDFLNMVDMIVVYFGMLEFEIDVFFFDDLILWMVISYEIFFKMDFKIFEEIC